MPPRKPKTYLQARTAIAKEQMAKMTNVNISSAMIANKREFHRRKLEKLKKKQKQRQEREKAETPAAVSDNTAAPKPPSPVDNLDDPFPQAPNAEPKAKKRRGSGSPEEKARTAVVEEDKTTETERRQNVAPNAGAAATPQSLQPRNISALMPSLSRRKRPATSPVAPDRAPPPAPPQTFVKTRVGEMIELDLAKSTASSLRGRGPERERESEGPRRLAYVPSQAESSVQRMNRLIAESRGAYGGKEFGWDQGGTRAG
ncbi:hypothetical protein IWZ03DRAFT_413087 [Phyllosticta citriasiana]|uniref:Uncharacterized protein n=1 Tax=Phyllosticta citriasiana TaxID=595635 RepID=A0ABR1KUU3_9PEZI